MPLERLLALAGAASIGVGQICFGLVLDNLEQFPREGAFHLWIVLAAFALPLAAFAGLDLLLDQLGGARATRGWRALLFAGVMLSFLRQIQTAYPGAFAPWIGWIPPLALGPLIAGLSTALALRWPDGARRYLAALGLLGVLLTGTYVAKTGLWGPAWRAPAPARASASPPVYVLIFDELSYDVLQEKDVVKAEFPAFARLAADAAFFTRATSNHYWTELSIPTMLSGRLQPKPGAPSYLDLLAKDRDVLLLDNTMKSQGWTGNGVRVRGRGYDLALSPGASIRYLLVALEESPFRRTALREQSTVKLPPAGAWGGNMGERDWRRDWIPRDAEQLVASVDRAACKGRVTYWHSLVPHAPFLFDRNGVPHGKQPDTFYPAEMKQPGFDAAAVHALYLEQVRYVDRILGRFLDRLKAEGIYDETVLVVTSDHGLRTWDPAFQPPGFPDVHNDLAPHVPLLIKAPGLAPGPRDVDYQHVDLAPTLLKLLKVDFDPKLFQGRPALDAGTSKRRKIFMSMSDGYALDPASGLWRRLPANDALEF